MEVLLNEALYLKEKLVFEEKNIAAPVPKKDEVLIKVKSVECADQIFITMRMGNLAVTLLKNRLYWP